MSSPPTFAERLRLAMALRNLNNTDLARKINRQERTVGNWCNGTTEAKASDIAACGEAMDVSADYLVGLADDPSGLTPGRWVLDVDLLHRARTHPHEEVVPGYRVPQRPIIVTNDEAERLMNEITKQRKRGKSDGQA